MARDNDPAGPVRVLEDVVLAAADVPPAFSYQSRGDLPGSRFDFLFQAQFLACANICAMAAAIKMEGVFA
jgi:hypothetical protein